MEHVFRTLDANVNFYYVVSTTQRHQHTAMLSKVLRPPYAIFSALSSAVYCLNLFILVNTLALAPTEPRAQSGLQLFVKFVSVCSVRRTRSSCCSALPRNKSLNLIYFRLIFILFLFCSSSFCFLFTRCCSQCG